MKRIYLDYNATTPIYNEVSQIMIEMLQDGLPTNASSIHQDGRNARKLLEESRYVIAKALGIDAYKDDLQIIFTSCGTETNNLIVSNFSSVPMFAGSTEHISILEAGHNNLTLIPVNKNGLISADILRDMLRQVSGKKLVSIMLANNETGVIQDIKLLSEIAHQENAIFHCDASQAFGKIEVNFKGLGCDAMTISSHKCGGPLGASALIVRKNININSLIKGGKQELSLRSGTENLLAIIGFAKAAQISLDKYEHIACLRDFVEQELTEAEIFGANALRLPNTSSIRMPNIKAEEQLIKFDLAGFSISAGSACSSGRIASSHVLSAMGIDQKQANEIIRLSIGPETKKTELIEFVKQWKKIYQDGN